MKQFFDSMDFFDGPAGTRWAALFYGPLMSRRDGGLRAQIAEHHDEDLND